MASLILASASPRRRELLQSLGLEFTVISPDIDESVADHLPPAARVLDLARRKAEAAAATAGLELGGLGDRILIAADTLVALPLGASPLPPGIPADGVLGKPVDRREAEAMVRALAGRRHEVHTGLAVLAAGRPLETIGSVSLVDFSILTEEEISAYLDFGDWAGVAGAYRIQGYAARHITSIQGSWSGIVGLPIRELYVILGRIGAAF